MSFWLPFTWKKALLLAGMIAFYAFLFAQCSTMKARPRYSDTAQIYLCGRSEFDKSSGVFTATEYGNLAICGGVDGHLYEDPAVVIVWREANEEESFVDLAKPVWLDHTGNWAHFRADPGRRDDFILGEYVVEFINGREILKTLKVDFRP